MRIYCYSARNGEYLGEGTADPSPLEPGKWLIPANATIIAPPRTGEREVAVFAADAWSIKPDYRGCTLYATDGTPVLVDEIGVAPGADLLEIAPKPSKERIWVEIYARRSSLMTPVINALDRHRNQKDFGIQTTLTEGEAVQVATYLEALRNIDQQHLPDVADLSNVTWPEAPACLA